MSIDLTPLSFYGIYENKESYNYNSTAGTNGEDREITLKYKIIGSSDPSSSYYFATDSDAKDYFRDWYLDAFGAPPYFEGLPLKSVEFNATSNDLIYDASLTFAVNNTDDDEQQKSKEPQEDINEVTVGLSDINWSFNTTTTHKKNSLETVGGWSSYLAPDQPEPTPEEPDPDPVYIMRDFGRKIAVNEDGESEGVDVLTPTCSFNITCRLIPESPINPLAIISSIGTVNEETWGPFNPREALFIGCDIKRVAESIPVVDASGETRNEKKWLSEIVFNFQYSPSAYYPTPLDEDVKIYKAGFDIVWPYVTRELDNETNAWRPVTKQINIERVYPVADFATVFPWTWDYTPQE